MKVKQFISSQFSSNTYLVSKDDIEGAWLIDIGSFDGVLKILPQNTSIKGAFITHPHFDHIYEINKLIDKFPDCVIFTSKQGKSGLFSDRINLSFYHEQPIVFTGTNIRILKDNERIEIFDNIFLEVLETPGHDRSCLSYLIKDYLFTGDSFIPGVPVITKLKGGDREASKQSIEKILGNISENTIVCAGHGEMVKMNKSGDIMKLQ